MKTDTPTTKEVVRLQHEVYLKLEAKFSRPLVTDSSTPISIGYYLGTEAVLKELRNGITMERSNA